MIRKLTIVAIVATFFGCASTAQNQQAVATAAAVVNPIINAALSAYAAKYGIPPTLTTSVAQTLENQLWGMASQSYAGQPASNGTTIPVVGSAVVAQLPASTGVSSGNALNTAATLLSNVTGS